MVNVIINKLKVIKSKFNKGTIIKYGFILSMMGYTQVLFWFFYLYTHVDATFMAFQSINFSGARAWVGFSNFQIFFKEIFEKNSLIAVSFVNSIKMYLLCFFISMPLYIFFSYFIFKKIWGSNIIRAIIMLPQILSAFIIALIFKKFLDSALPSIMNSLGWENFPILLEESKYAFGTSIFYMIWLSFAVSLIVYPNAFNSIDKSIIESAQIDGISGMIQELRYILLPLIYPTLTTFIVTGFAQIFAISGPLFEFYMYNAPGSIYNVGYYFTVKTYFASSTGYPILAAGGMVMTILIAPSTWLIKYILEKYGPSEESRIKK